MRYLQKLLDRPDLYFIYLPQPTKSVYIDVFVKTGRLHESDEQIGLGHLLDHYINGSLYAKYLDRLSTNAWIAQEHLQFHLTTDTKKAQKDVKRFINGVFSPDFSNEELFLFERQSIINEIRNDMANVGTRQFYQVIEHRFLPGSPYRRPTFREAENVPNLSLEDVQSHHQSIFHKNNVAVFMAAHKPPKSLVNDIFHQFQSLDLPNREPLPYPKHRYSDSKVVISPEYDVAGQQYVSLSFPGLSYEDSVERRIALNIFCRIFTGLSRHSIFAPLRRTGIYAIDYRNIYYCHFGMVDFWATIPPHRLEQFLEVVTLALERFKSEPLSATFLNGRLKGVRERTRNAWRNNNDLYNWLMEYILDEGEVRTPKEVFASLSQITPEFVMRLAQEAFRRETLNLIVSGEAPEEDERTIASWLKLS